MRSVRKIDLMHELFGKANGQKCKDCEHLMTFCDGKTYRKCEVYGCTMSSSSDWRLRYDACGMFNKDYSGSPVMFKKKESEPAAQIHGQESIF